MKKNKMMRIASVLLVVTLLSTCVISGTFAKYVTKAEGEDTARVAKWGVLLSMEGDALFDTKYEVDDDSFLLTNEEYSVISANSDKVVAPGTEGKHIKATITGAPEVAFRLIFGLNAEKEICLPKGTYTDYTELVHSTDGTYAYTGEFTLDADYYPVQYSLKYGDDTATGNIKDIVDALNEIFADLTGSDAAVAVDEDGSVTGIEGAVYADFPANADVFEDGVVLELSWAWTFPEGELANVITDIDKADTYLGNVAAGKVTDTNAVTDMEVEFTIIAVQID